jgi:hypothetical protein
MLLPALFSSMRFRVYSLLFYFGQNCWCCSICLLSSPPPPHIFISKAWHPPISSSLSNTVSNLFASHFSFLIFTREPFIPCFFFFLTPTFLSLETFSPFFNTLTFNSFLKGSLTREFRLQVFFINQCPPGP